MENSTSFLDKIVTEELAIVVSLYAFLLFTVVSGNGLVLVAFSINERLRTATNKLIIGLAVSDILVGFVSIPCWLNITISRSQHRKMSCNRATVTSQNIIEESILCHVRCPVALFGHHSFLAASAVQTMARYLHANYDNDMLFYSFCHNFHLVLLNLPLRTLPTDCEASI